MEAKTDSVLKSMLMGRGLAAVILIIALISRSMGVDISADDQQSLQAMIEKLVADFGPLLSLVLVIVSKYRSVIGAKKSDTVPSGTGSGAPGAKNMLVIALAAASLMSMSIFTGCPAMGVGQGTATQQITAGIQADNTLTAAQRSMLVADAVYYDFLGIYEKSAQTYLDYAPIIEKTNPADKIKLKEILQDMKRTLDRWKALQGEARLAAMNSGEGNFSALRRHVLMRLAIYMSAQ